MLLEKDLVVAILQAAMDQVNALPDASPVPADMVPKADLDAAQAVIASDEAKIEKAKEDLA